MISRKFSGGAICLGCRIRLLSQATRPRYPHAVTRYNAAVASRRQTLRWFTDDQTAARSAEKDESLDEEHDTSIKTELGTSAPDESPPKSNVVIRRYYDAGPDYNPKPSPILGPAEEQVTFKRINRHEQHLSRNRLLTEAAESLGQDMLGKPAYAIVMKDSGLYKRKKRSAAASDTAAVQEDSSQAGIQALLERQDDAVTPAEVRANIDGLCPESETYLPEKEFRAIQNELTEGFLKPQLEDYINKFKAALQKVEASVETDEYLESEQEEGELEAQAEDVQDHTVSSEPNPQAEVETDGNLETEREEGGLEAQAEDHIGSSEANPEAEADFTPPYSKYPWIRELSPWVRLSSDEVAAGGLEEDADQHLHGYVSENASSKEKLAVRIMRECWGLHIEERMGGFGQVEVTLRRIEFTMLMRGTRRFLKRINERVLERGESLEVFKPRQTIRFVVSRPKAETLIHELDVILKKLRARNFPASFIGREQTAKVIDPEVLEEVGRISNTFVSQSPSTKRITVTWLESRDRKQEGEPEYDVEDMRHVVARLLLTALNPEPALTKLYAPQETETSDRGQFLVDEYSKEKWNWKDKLGRWARLSKSPKSPALRRRVAEGRKLIPDDLLLSNTPGSTFEEEDSATRTVGEPSDEAKLLQDSNVPALGDAEIQSKGNFPYQPVRWSPELHTTTSAVFGHILLDATGAPAKALTPVIGVHENLDKYARILSPIVPHPMQLITLHGQQNQENQQKEPRRDVAPPSFPAEPTILLRFVPTPSQNQYEPNLPGPFLELRLALTDSDEPEITGVHSMRAITETHVHDVMLPASPVDVRVQQQRFATLQGHPEELALWQPIESFLRRARLNISEGKLEMPEQQRFQIPARLFYQSYPSHLEPPAFTHPKITTKLGRRAARLAKSIQSRTPDDKNQPISILYEFAGLELQRAVRIPYKGHTLTYTSIEAGQGGGRRAELALSPKQPSAGVSSNDALKQLDTQALLQKFLDLAFETAQTAKFWSGFAQFDQNA